MSYVQCSTCGKRVSNDVVGPLVIRAFVQCPECIEAEPPRGQQQVIDHRPFISTRERRD